MVPQTGVLTLLDIDIIRQLIDMMVANELVEMSLRDGDVEVNLRRPTAHAGEGAPVVTVQPAATNPTTVTGPQHPPSAAPDAKEEDLELVEIKSPTPIRIRLCLWKWAAGYRLIRWSA